MPRFFPLGRVSRPKQIVTLLGRPDCPLCMDAERAVAAEFGRRNVSSVDVTTDRGLEDTYIFRIPVLIVDDRVVAEGRIDRATARAARRGLERDRAASSP